MTETIAKQKLIHCMTKIIPVEDFESLLDGVREQLPDDLKPRFDRLYSNMTTPGCREMSSEEIDELWPEMALDNSKLLTWASL